MERSGHDVVEFGGGGRWPRWCDRRWSVFFLLAVGLYAAIVFLTWLGQRRLLYIADPARVPPASIGLTNVVEREITAPDGERIVGWQARAKPGRKTLLYFHGNAGTLAMRAERVRRFAGDGLGIFIMAYRGYNGSTGKPSEAAIEGDARLVYDMLIAEGVVPKNLVLFGEFSGSGVAVRLASQRTVGGVVLDAPYTSMVELAAGIYPYLPVRALILDRYESQQAYQGDERAVADPAWRGRRLDTGANGKALVRTGQGAKAPCRVRGWRDRTPTFSRSTVLMRS